MYRKTDQIKSKNKTKISTVPHTISACTYIQNFIGLMIFIRYTKKYLGTTSFKINICPIMSFFVMVVHESLVCPEKVKLPAVLQKNPSGPTDSLGCQHLLHIWTFSDNDYMILRSIFSHWGQPRDSYTTITEGSSVHWCSRRNNHAVRVGGVNF